jgi:hypothetical protein
MRRTTLVLMLLADNIGGRVGLTYDLAVFGLALPEIDWRVRA